MKVVTNYSHIGRVGVDATAGLAGMVVLLGLAAASVALLGWQAAWPHPVRAGGITLDRLSGLLTLLVAGVGAVTYRFSMRYLDDDSGRPRFLRLLMLTVGAAYVLMLATDLVLLLAAWTLTSVGLHGLLTFYGDRPASVAPARKKFLISRLGDVALVAAIGLVWWGWGTTDLHVFLARVSAGDAGPAVDAVALLVALAALTKSAQFPFHSWLPETMESPTPVSALMHAGVINAGGALLLRFAPLVAGSSSALLLLAVVGTLTAVVGTLAMWAQVKVKRTLAWSTVSQMGFMMVQCGLAVFPAAAAHMVGHGCYKAWSFLRTGGVPQFPVGPSRASVTQTLATAAVGTGVAVPALSLASWVTGFDPSHSPGEMALAAILALSVGQLWVAVFRSGVSGVRDVVGRVAVAVVLTVGSTALAFALYRGAAAFLVPVLGTVPVPTGPIAWLAATLPVLGFAALVVAHACLPALATSATGRALHVHALHGFYLGAVADRFVEKLWRGGAARKDVSYV